MIILIKYSLYVFARSIKSVGGESKRKLAILLLFEKAFEFFVFSSDFLQLLKVAFHQFLLVLVLFLKLDVGSFQP